MCVRAYLEDLPLVPAREDEVGAANGELAALRGRAPRRQAVTWREHCRNFYRTTSHRMKT